MYIKENNDKKNNKRLVRPFSALNIRSFHSNNSNNHNNSTFEKLIKKEDNETNLINKNEIDLDLLFEKQLQKLREINKQDDINDKNEENHKIYINNNINSINNNIDQNIQKDSNNEKFGINNTINKYKRPNIRPSSHLSKKFKSLPRISSPKYNKKIYQEKDENSSNNDYLQLRPKSPFHKDFGKVPKYIQEMKIKNEILKNIQKKKKEEEKYPKGTRLLSEEERVFTLQKLKESKKELENIIEKLPITLNSLSSRNKQQKLYKELDEIDQAILTFSKKQVFVKIDS